MKHSLPRVVAACALALAVSTTPAAADTTTAGPNKLTFETGLTVKKAAAKGARMAADLELKTSLVRADGQRPPETLNTIQFTLGAGVSFDPKAQVQCRESVFAPKGKPAVANCPKGSVVGTGTAIVDARPTVPQPLTGKVTIVNGILEPVAPDGTVVPRSGLLALVSAAGVDAYYSVDFFRQGTLLLVGVAPTPPPGTPPALFTVTGLDLKLRGKGKVARKPYIRAPRACKPITFSATYVLNDVPLTAKDRLVCE
ncbi:MAG TPA: hypothetical protein VN238_09855 [Solirubrobacteraceae bacterium]|nr:hypothetical protein [Solirubrobacteraceae bacterium]